MPKSNFSIAIIDDEEQIRRALLRLLRSTGMEARAYASAQEFLSSWRSDPPGCVVLDLQMPGLNGLELMQCLTQLGAKLPIIIITAHDAPEMRANCLQAGAVAYLRKPLDDRILLDAIEKTQLH